MEDVEWVEDGGLEWDCQPVAGTNGDRTGTRLEPGDGRRNRDRSWKREDGVAEDAAALATTADGTGAETARGGTGEVTNGRTENGPGQEDKCFQAA